MEGAQALLGMSSWPGTHTPAKGHGVAKGGSKLGLLNQGPRLSGSNCARNRSE